VYSFFDALIENEKPIARFMKIMNELINNKKRLSFKSLNILNDFEVTQMEKTNLEKRIEKTNQSYAHKDDWIEKRKKEAKERRELLERYKHKFDGVWNDIYLSAISHAIFQYKRFFPEEFDKEDNPITDSMKQKVNMAFEVKLADFIKQRMDGLI
jgi:SMC interacting uncharacterized protein involved in chromosome segregation